MLHVRAVGPGTCQVSPLSSSLPPAVRLTPIICAQGTQCPAAFPGFAPLPGTGSGHCLRRWTGSESLGFLCVLQCSKGAGRPRTQVSSQTPAALKQSTQFHRQLRLSWGSFRRAFWGLRGLIASKHLCFWVGLQPKFGGCSSTHIVADPQEKTWRSPELSEDFRPHPVSVSNHAETRSPNIVGAKGDAEVGGGGYFCT